MSIEQKTSKPIVVVNVEALKNGKLEHKISGNSNVTIIHKSKEAVLECYDETFKKLSSTDVVFIVADEALPTQDTQLSLSNSPHIVEFTNAHGSVDLSLQDLLLLLDRNGKIEVQCSKNSSDKALSESIDMVLERTASIKNATGILVHFLTHQDFSFFKITQAMQKVQDQASKEADIMWCASRDPNVAENHVKVLLIASGF